MFYLKLLLNIGEITVIPKFESISTDDFLSNVNKSGHKWVVLTDENDKPHLVLDADGFLRAVLFTDTAEVKPYEFCHRPILVTDEKTPLGDLVSELRVGKDAHCDSVIDHDIILVWSEQQRRIITGADILGRLLKGIEADT